MMRKFYASDSDSNSNINNNSIIEIFTKMTTNVICMVINRDNSTVIRGCQLCAINIAHKINQTDLIEFLPTVVMAAQNQDMNQSPNFEVFLTSATHLHS